MNNAAALHELNRALAHFRRRQDHTPTPHSAREIAQMSMLAEYLTFRTLSYSVMT